MSAQSNYEITWLIRRIFRRMAQVAGENLETFGITAADRAVLEFLYPDEALSVPEIAQRYDVSRQHVQVTVNALLEKGLVAKRPNPRHKRSDLIRLFRRRYTTCSSGFEKTIRGSSPSYSGTFRVRQLATTLKTLRELNQRLQCWRTEMTEKLKYHLRLQSPSRCWAPSAILWSWNTIAGLFDGPEMQAKHAIAALLLLGVARTVAVPGDGSHTDSEGDTAMKINLLEYRPPRIAMLLLAVAAATNLTVPMETIGPGSFQNLGSRHWRHGFLRDDASLVAIQENESSHLSDRRDRGAHHGRYLPVHAQSDVSRHADDADRYSNVHRHIAVLPGGSDALCYPELCVLPV